MEEGKVCFIDDSVSGVGGTTLTLDAIVEPKKEFVQFISTDQFSLKDVFSGFEVFILGNLTRFTKNSLDALILLMESKRFCKIEFDYGYCEFRGSIPHKLIKGEDCQCPFGSTGNKILSMIYSLIKENCLHTFYMSESQLNIHSEKLEWIDSDKKSVLSSCFTEDNMLKFQSLKPKPKNNKYAIIDGQGGWHTQAKGIKQSIDHANKKELDFDLIKTETHNEMLNLLSEYKGLISLPIIEDTCPRITIEARYMGLDVITNENSQHITEDWWKSDDETAFNFTKNRPKYFWETIKCLKS